jgi:hypothetical protein
MRRRNREEERKEKKKEKESVSVRKKRSRNNERDHCHGVVARNTWQGGGGNSCARIERTKRKDVPGG